MCLRRSFASTEARIAIMDDKTSGFFRMFSFERKCCLGHSLRFSCLREAMKLAYSHLSARKTSFCSNDNMPTKRIRMEYDTILGSALAYAMFEFWNGWRACFLGLCPVFNFTAGH